MQRGRECNEAGEPSDSREQKVNRGNFSRFLQLAMRNVRVEISHGIEWRKRDYEIERERQRVSEFGSELS